MMMPTTMKSTAPANPAEAPVVAVVEEEAELTVVDEGGDVEMRVEFVLSMFR